MTKKEQIENNAYMILQDLAFVYGIEEGQVRLKVFNLKNVAQVAVFRPRNTDLLFCKGNLSNENTYKAQFIVERNKARLLEGMNIWVNTQSIK